MLSYTKGLCLIVLIGCCHAYPRGAPDNICGRYVPGGHRNRNTPLGNPPQGPYTLDVQPGVGGGYTVTLQGSQPFKGFVIQAMPANPSWKRFPEGAEDIVGTFRPSQQGFMSRLTQLRRCAGMSGSTVITHTDDSPKTNVQMIWTPPQMASDPNFRLIATVVRDFDTFYVVQSDTINSQAAGSSPGVSSGTSAGSASSSFPTNSVANNVISPTVSPTGSSFLTPNQGSFTFSNMGSTGMSSSVGMNGFAGDSNTLTGSSSTNLAIPSTSFFSSQESGMSNQGAGFNSMNALSGFPGANDLPIIPNDINFPRNFPSISSQTSETNSLSNINGSLAERNIFAEAPSFSNVGTQVHSDASFTGNARSSNESGFANNSTNQSSSETNIFAEAPSFSNVGTQVHSDASFTGNARSNNESGFANNSTNQSSFETNIFAEAPSFSNVDTQVHSDASFTGNARSSNESGFANNSTNQSSFETNIFAEAPSFSNVGTQVHSDASFTGNAQSSNESGFANNFLVQSSSETNIFAEAPSFSSAGIQVHSDASFTGNARSRNESGFANNLLVQSSSETNIFAEAPSFSSADASFTGNARSSNESGFGNNFLDQSSSKTNIFEEAPTFSSAGIHDSNFTGNSRFGNDSDFANNLAVQSDSIIFQNHGLGLKSELLINNETRENISSEFLANPPIALEMIVGSTESPKRIPKLPLEATLTTNISSFNPSMIIQPFESNNTVKSFHSTNTSSHSNSSDTFLSFPSFNATDPVLPPTTVDPFLPFSTVDPLQLSNTSESILLTDAAKSFDLQSTVKPIQSPTTTNTRTRADSFLPPTTVMPFQPPPPPTTIKPFNIPDPFQQSSTAIPFQAPTKPKPIDIPMSVKPLLPRTTTPKPLDSGTFGFVEPVEVIKPFDAPTTPLSFEIPASEKPFEPPQVILFDPSTTPAPLDQPATYDPLAPPPPIFLPDNFPSPVSITLPNKTDAITVPITRPVASIDLPIRIDSPISNALPEGDVRVVLKSLSETAPLAPGAVSSPSSASSATFEVVSTSLSDVMGTSDTNFVQNPTLRVEPVVNIINVPVPSGQIAAVLNFSSSDGMPLPTRIPALTTGSGRFVTIGRPLGGMQGQGQFGAQPGSFGSTPFGQGFGGQFRGPSTFGRRTTFPMGPSFPGRGMDRRGMGFGGQGQRFGQFGGSFGGPSRPSGTPEAGAAGNFGFQQFANPMPSGFVGQSATFGGQGSTGMEFAGQGPTFIGQGAVRQFRFGPQGRQVQTFGMQPQNGQITTFRFGSQPGQFSRGGFMTSGVSQGQGQIGQGQGQGQGQAAQGFTSTTFGQPSGTDSFLTPVGV